MCWGSAISDQSQVYGGDGGNINGMRWPQFSKLYSLGSAKEEADTFEAEEDLFEDDPLQGHGFGYGYGYGKLGDGDCSLDARLTKKTEALSLPVWENERSPISGSLSSSGMFIFSLYHTRAHTQ